MVRAHPEIAGLVDWRPLARGGFSTVWQARQESLDRQVAVKVDHRPLNEDKERRRFLREAGAAGRLSGHMGIVTVHDAGILSDGRPYLVMDLCTGGSLTQWLKPEGRQSQRRVRDVGVRIADALAAAHASGVLHRDIKPANILIDSYGHAGLADFGLAALPEPGVELSVTLEGMTPAYAPKEVFYLGPPTQYGDVYSLAATMYALLDGKPPRWPDTGTPSLPQLLELQRQPIERLPDVDEAFMDVLLRALSDEVEERPTAAEFRDQLSELTFAPSVNNATVVATAVPGAQAGADPERGPEHEPGPDSTGDDTGSASRGYRGALGLRAGRQRVLAGIVAALLAVALLLAGINSWGPGPRAAVPGTAPVTAADPSSPTGSPSASESPSATPTEEGSPSPSAPASSSAKEAPAGFVDCSEGLGKGNYCVADDEPECWNNYFQYAKLNAAADMVDCNNYHELQTFAAGSVPAVITEQAKLVARPEVKALCTREVLDKVLAPKRSLKSWDIKVLPAPINIEGDNLFRCLVGPAQTAPHKLKITR